VTAPSHSRKSRLAIAALALLAWLAFAGWLLRYQGYGNHFSPAQRVLVDRSVTLFAREMRLDDSKIRRLYSLSLLHRLDQTCVRLTTYRDRRGGAQYCYQDSDRRLIEERSWVVDHIPNLIELVLDSIDRE
jgi:hypothetical protein